MKLPKFRRTTKPGTKKTRIFGQTKIGGGGVGRGITKMQTKPLEEKKTRDILNTFPHSVRHPQSAPHLATNRKCPNRR